MSDCDIPAFYNHVEPKARKEHRCCECRAPIAIGEKHLKVTGCWEGSISTFRQHLLCAEACMFIRDQVFEECIGFGELFRGEGAEAWRREHSFGFDDNSGWRETTDKMKPEKRKLRGLVAQIRLRERAAKKKAA